MVLLTVVTDIWFRPAASSLFISSSKLSNSTCLSPDFAARTLAFASYPSILQYSEDFVVSTSYHSAAVL